MTGHLDEATETWTDLDAMFAAELPPCGFVRDVVLRFVRFERRKRLTCREPSVAVVTLACPSCGPITRPVCRGHLGQVQAFGEMPLHRRKCGRCGEHPLTFVGLS